MIRFDRFPAIRESLDRILALKTPSPNGYKIESAWSLTAITALLRRWRERAADADDPTYRHVHEQLACELESVLQETFDEAISVEQLACFAGRSVGEIRRLVEQDLLPNLGTQEFVRVRRRELFAEVDRLVCDDDLFRVLLDRIEAPSPI